MLQGAVRDAVNALTARWLAQGGEPTGLILVAGWITEPEYLDASKFPWWV